MATNTTTNLVSASHSVSLAPEVASAHCSLASNAAPPGGDGVFSTAEVKELLLIHSAPAPLPPAWTFLSRSDDIRRLRCPPAELALALQHEYSVERLLASRIVVPAANGQVRLSPVLADERSKFLMRLDKDRNLTDLISARGAMISSDPPCFQCVRRRGQWLLASTDDDLQVLHLLGFKVATVAGLAKLNARQVRRLLGKPTDPLNLNRMTLVGWNVGAIDHAMPKELAKVMQHIWNMEFVFGYHPLAMPFQFWQPTDKQFDHIRAAISFRDPGAIRGAFNTSIDGAVPAVEAWNLLLDAADTDLVTAEKELQRVIGKQGFMPKGAEAQRALHRYMAAVDRATCDRFLEAAAASRDPLEASLLILAREVFDDLAKSQPIVHAAKRVIDNQHPAPLKLTSEALAERKQLLDSLLKIHKAIGRNN